MEKAYVHVRYIPLGPHSMYHFADKKKSIVSYKADTVNFLFFGRIDKYKGIDILLRAYQKIEEKYKDKVTLTIVGNGDLSGYSKLLKEVDHISIVNRWIKDEEVESVFTGKNIVTVCPYRDATQSGVILVSYDYGVPVIAADTGGLEEQVIDGETGFLIERCNIQALYTAMKKFIESPQIINKMKIHISEYVEKISWDRSAEILMDIINLQAHDWSDNESSIE